MSAGGAGDVSRMGRVSRRAAFHRVPHAEWVECDQQHVRHRVVHLEIEAQQRHRQGQHEQQSASSHSCHALS
eukprot:3025516-Pleurochrysis_carterae.AAC.2